MTNTWQLPKTATIGGVKYKINSDFRDVLEIFSYLNDESRPEYLRWLIAVGLFYEEEIPEKDQKEAMEYLAEFISYGNGEKNAPKLLDWDQDARMIIGDINKVAGKEVRAMPYLHWWSFLSYFYGIGEGQLLTVVSIRSKRMRGEKLEKWEEKYYRENQSRIDFKRKETADDKAVQEYLKKWL